MFDILNTIFLVHNKLHYLIINYKKIIVAYHDFTDFVGNVKKQQ